MPAEARNLLLVDDDDPYRAVLARSLARRGFQVTAVATPAEALVCCQEQPPDYVNQYIENYETHVTPTAKNRKKK